MSLPKRIDHSLSPTLSHSQAVRWAQGMCWVMDWADQSRAELVMCERRREYQTLGEFSGLMCDRWAAAGLLWRTYERDAASHEGLEESVGVREEEEEEGRHGEDGSFVMFLSLSLKWNKQKKTKHWFVCVWGGVHYIYRGPGGAPWGTPSMFTVKCDCFIYLNQGVNIYYHILNIPSPTQTTSGVLIAPIWLFKAPKTFFCSPFVCGIRAFI